MIISSASRYLNHTIYLSQSAALSIGHTIDQACQRHKILGIALAILLTIGAVTATFYASWTSIALLHTVQTMLDYHIKGDTKSLHWDVIMIRALDAGLVIRVSLYAIDLFSLQGYWNKSRAILAFLAVGFKLDADQFLGKKLSDGVDRLLSRARSYRAQLDSYQLKHDQSDARAEKTKDSFFNDLNERGVFVPDSEVPFRSQDLGILSSMPSLSSVSLPIPAFLSALLHSPLHVPSPSPSPSPMPSPLSVLSPSPSPLPAPPPLSVPSPLPSLSPVLSPSPSPSPSASPLPGSSENNLNPFRDSSCLSTPSISPDSPRSVSVSPPFTLLSQLIPPPMRRRASSVNFHLGASLMPLPRPINVSRLISMPPLLNLSELVTPEIVPEVVDLQVDPLNNEVAAAESSSELIP